MMVEYEMGKGGVHMVNSVGVDDMVVVTLDLMELVGMTGVQALTQVCDMAGVDKERVRFV